MIKTSHKKLLLALLLAALFLLGGQEIHAAVSPLRCIGHRGTRDHAPDDTIASYKKAWELGYNHVECDVWYTWSGEFMISHESSLKDITGKDVNIKDITTENRVDYPIIKGKNIDQYPVQYICNLQEFLQLCRRYHLTPWIHLKGGSSDFTEEVLDELNRVLEENNPGSRPVVFTSDRTVSQWLEKYTWPRGYLTAYSDSERLERGLDFAASLNCTYIFIMYDADKGPDTKCINLAHEWGVKVIYYNVFLAEEEERLLANGVDMCVVDRLPWQPLDLIKETRTVFDLYFPDQPETALQLVWQRVFIASTYLQDRLKASFGW